MESRRPIFQGFWILCLVVLRTASFPVPLNLVDKTTITSLSLLCSEIWVWLAGWCWLGFPMRLQSRCQSPEGLTGWRNPGFQHGSRSLLPSGRWAGGRLLFLLTVASSKVAQVSKTVLTGLPPHRQFKRGRGGWKWRCLL